MILLYYILLILIYAIIPIYYIKYMDVSSKKSWGFQQINDDLNLKISIIIPTYNEEKIIEYKLQNLLKLNYPEELIQTIIVDSNSSDNTQNYVRNFISCNPNYDILLLVDELRKGKTAALNKALQYIKYDLVIISDSDCLLDSDIIRKALPYIVDPNVGAVAAEEYMLNKNSSWVTQGENYYREKWRCIRLGESKKHSTIRFEGGFAVYKKDILVQFNEDTGADDSGTALDIIQKGKRAIFVPDLRFYTYFPSSLQGKIKIKIRRGNQLILLWIRVLKLMIQGKLKLPKEIALPNLYLHLVSPILFGILLVISFYIVYIYPYFLLLSLLLLVPSLRLIAIEYIENNVLMLISMFVTLFGVSFKVWEKAEDSRNLIIEESLLIHNLI